VTELSVLNTLIEPASFPEEVYFQHRCESLKSLQINIILSVYHVRFEVSLRWYVTQCIVVSTLLTPWNRLLLEDIALLQPVRYSPHFVQPEDHFHLPKSSPLVPMVSKTNLIHALKSCFFELHCFIAPSSSPKPLTFYLSFMLPDQNPSCISRVLHAFQLISLTDIFTGWIFQCAQCLLKYI